MPARKREQWNLYKHGLSVSGLRLWLKCREQFRLKYVEGWRSIIESPALTWGKAWHDCAEHVASGKSPKTIGRVLDKYVVQRPGLGRDDGKLIVAQVKTMFPLYLTYWSDHDAAHRYVAQEQRFDVQFRVTPERDQAPTIPLLGYFDGVVRNKETGRLWLLETKTKADIDDADLLKSLPLNLQTMTYALAMRDVYGEAPEGIYYNLVKRPRTKPLHPKNKPAETLDEYAVRLHNTVVDETSKYFKRVRVELDGDDLDRFADTVLVPLLADVVRWWEAIADDPHKPNTTLHYPNPEALFDGPWKSDYFDLVTTGKTTGYVKYAAGSNPRPVGKPKRKSLPRKRKARRSK